MRAPNSDCPTPIAAASEKPAASAAHGSASGSSASAATNAPSDHSRCASLSESRKLLAKPSPSAPQSRPAAT